MIRWLWTSLIFKRAASAGHDPMPMAKEFLTACKDYPEAREHIKAAMRAIFDRQMEQYE